MSQLAAVGEGVGIAALRRFLVAADKAAIALPMEQAKRLCRDKNRTAIEIDMRSTTYIARS